MAWAGAPSFGRSGPERVRVGTLEASVRALDPASRALLDLSLRRRLRDDDMAPLLRIDAFNLAWRRARAIERLASGLGLTEPGGLAQVRAALPYLPDSAWCVPLALPAGPPSDADAGTVDGVAETIEFDAIRPEPEPPPSAPEHAWGPRTLAVTAPAPPPAAPTPAPRPLPQRVRVAVATARDAARARPEAARGALLWGAGALVGALLSRRRR
jgi:hypothetical protein